MSRRPAAPRLGRGVAVALMLAGTIAVGLFAAAPDGSAQQPDDVIDYEWERAPLGPGGFVTGLVAAPGDGEQSVAYARTDVGGAFRWDQESSTWSQMLIDDSVSGGGLQPADYSVISVAVDPHDSDRVFLATGSDFDPQDGAELSRTGRLWHSENGGRTWQQAEQRWFINGNQPARLGSERLAVDPVDPDHIVFGTQREGLWESFDGGSTWSQVPLAMVPDGTGEDWEADQVGVSFVEFAERSSGPPVLMAGVANRGVYAADGEGAWSELLPISPGEIPLVGAVGGDRVVVPVNSPGVDNAFLIEVDLGSFDVRELPTPMRSDTWHVAVDPFDPQHLVLADAAVRDSHLWTSVNGGTEWTAHDIEIVADDVPWLATTDLDEWMSVGRIVFDPVEHGKVWFAEGMAVWTTHDLTEQTVTWTSASRGLEVMIVSSVLPLGDGAALISVADRQGFRVSADGAYPVSTLLDGRFISGMSMDQSGRSPLTIAWIGGEAHRGGLPDRRPRGAVSHDGGQTWTEMDGLVRDMFAGEIAVSGTDPDVMVWMPSSYDGPRALEEHPVGIYVSKDGGQSWERTTIDGEDGTFHRVYAWYTRRALAADRVDGSFYAISDLGRFFVSVDGGLSWEQAEHAPPCSMEADCHVYGQIHATPDRAGEVWATLGAEGLYVTEDAGESAWRRVEGIEEAHAFAIARSENGAAVMYLQGRRSSDDSMTLLTSSDGGDTWKAIDPSRPLGLGQRITALGVEPGCSGRIFVGFAGSGLVVGQPLDSSCGTTPG